jgi:hypothetical protein
VQQLALVVDDDFGRCVPSSIIRTIRPDAFPRLIDPVLHRDSISRITDLLDLLVTQEQQHRTNAEPMRFNFTAAFHQNFLRARQFLCCFLLLHFSVVSS